MSVTTACRCFVSETKNWVKPGKAKTGEKALLLAAQMLRRHWIKIFFLFYTIYTHSTSNLHRI